MNALPTTSRAAVFHAVGQPLTLESFPIPQPQGSEAIVRVRCATVCGSDLHSFHGRRHSPVPSVLGHEMVAEIVAAGPAGVSDFRGQPLAPGRPRDLVDGLELRRVFLLPARTAAEMRAAAEIRPREDRPRPCADRRHGGILSPAGAHGDLQGAAERAGRRGQPGELRHGDRGGRVSQRGLLQGANGGHPWGRHAGTDGLRDGRLQRCRASHRPGAGSAAAKHGPALRGHHRAGHHAARGRNPPTHLRSHARIAGRTSAWSFPATPRRSSWEFGSCAKAAGS